MCLGVGNQTYWYYNKAAVIVGSVTKKELLENAYKDLYSILQKNTRNKAGKVSTKGE